jgi:hypothetical protein
MSSKYLLLLAFLFISSKLICQQDSTKLKIACDKSTNGDTLWLTVNNDRTESPGTVMMIASLEKIAVADTFFLPVIDTLNNYAFVIPPQYRFGNINLKAFYYPKIFSINGRLVGKKKFENLICLLFTIDKKIFNKEVTLAEDNTFKLPGLVFENNATVIFHYLGVNKKKEKPDMEIKQIPEVENFTHLVFAQRFDLTPDSIKAINDSLFKARSIPPQLTNKNDKLKILESVTVTGIRKSSAQKYNELYSTGVFNDQSEKLIDCLDNENILSYPDCLSFLRSRIAGLEVSLNRFGDNIIKWRGKETKAYFIDEIPVDLDQIVDLDLADIAIIKAYPPPFFGSLGNGDGGAIAIYTRTGEFVKSGITPNKWLFSVKGYAPAIHVLFEKNIK